MEKLIWLVWREPDADADGVAVGEQVLAAAADADAAPTVRGVTAWVEAPEAAAMRWGDDPRGLTLSASVTAWVDMHEHRGPVDDALSATSLTFAAYSVVESAPIEYGAERSWPDGERSPGVSLVTAFARVPGLADEPFYAGWHGSHTPLTFDIHPFWQYLRHSVLRGLTPGAPQFDAIVHESCRTLDDLLDPRRLFGADDRDGIKANIARMNDDLEVFADRSTLQTTPMHEIILSTL